MTQLFKLLVGLYPAEYRAEFGDEMRTVFLALVTSRNRSYLTESLGLLRGAALEHGRLLLERSRASWQTLAAMSGGMVIAYGMHVLMYWSLVPGKGKGLGRALEHLVSRVFLLAVLVGVAFGQQPPKQDSAALELAKSIYLRSFTALRAAKTLDDMKKLSDDLDSPDWISVDRFGRTVLTRKDADREFQSMLALPPDRRVTEMDIVWAERDADRLTVLAWMMPNEAERVDSNGDFGPKGGSHRLTRSTLIRDIFQSTADGWRRIRHDKLVPNDTVLAVDGIPRIMPPLDERHRVTK